MPALLTDLDAARLALCVPETEHNQHHIQVCPVYGRALKAHDEAKFLMAQVVR